MAGTLKELLSDKSVSADQAARIVADDCIQAIDKNEDATDIEDKLNELWSDVLTAAEQTPHDQQDKLVEVVQSIKNLPEATEKAKKLTVWEDVKRWDELPMFGPKAREQLDIAQEKSEEACVNINAFFARITAAGVQDFSLFGIWTLREALEDPPAEQVAKQTSPKLLKAASAWFIYASGELKKASKERHQFEGKIAKPGASLTEFKDEDGWRGFCDARWKVWEDRLTPLKEADLPEETKSLVARAVDSLTKA
ncbi:uncharacterized protein QYS62_008017 [Fusarium acuminatum]|uniref:Uncharacterized protein n=1 Tax=Fusarium acuminatum TaxID=5515 RepID=A0ABZ2X1G3_9HYPO